MGYGYGVWLVYGSDQFRTTHIGHVTVACFVPTLSQATQLYTDLVEKSARTCAVRIRGEPTVFPAAYYARDTNMICSWGYDCDVDADVWQQYHDICMHHDCDFSPNAHTSIEYAMSSDGLCPEHIVDRIMLCELKLVDIRSDSPEDWHIICTDD